MPWRNLDWVELVLGIIFWVAVLLAVAVILLLVAGTAMGY